MSARVRPAHHAASVMHFGWRWTVGLAVFAVMSSLLAAHLALYQGRPWATLAALGVPIAAASVKRHPWLAAAAIVATSVFLQLAYIGIGYSDQIDLGRSALDRALTGLSPYGILYTNATGGQNPFAYGPLAMVTAMGGVPLELTASALLLATIAWTRSWLTLCLVAGFPPYVYQAATGINDYSVSALLLVGWLVIKARPRVGVAFLALAAAIKPYIAAWFLPAVGVAGLVPSLWLVGVSAILWMPILIWGVGTYVESLRLVLTASTPSGWASNTIALPWVRLLAIPLSAAGLVVKQWAPAIILGSAAFVAVMFFGEWASLGYWVAVLPVTGVAIERTWLIPQSTAA